jgi:hypothetical protein
MRGSISIRYWATRIRRHAARLARNSEQDRWDEVLGGLIHCAHVTSQLEHHLAAVLLSHLCIAAVAAQAAQRRDRRSPDSISPMHA